jgi:DNA polymerase I-like protein with 3'-5' exonuclease and polymerase domains
MASQKCKATGELKLWSGRRRHFRNRFDDAHKAFNSVIQGGAADIVKDRMNVLFTEVNGPDCRMLLQVHDSVVFEIKNGMEDTYLPEIRRIMTDLPQFGVKFAVDIKKWSAK